MLASSPGGAKVDGGTQYNGNYYFADSTGALISVFKTKYLPVLGDDPTRGAVVNVTAGKVEVFPGDGGGGITQISGGSLQLAPGTATALMPTPMAVSASQIAKGSYSASLAGSYVTIPPNSYTENAMPTEFTYTSATTGKTYYDGLSLDDGSGNTILVDTFTFEYSGGACEPSDGGQPDLSAGHFNGVFDVEQTEDGAINGVIFYGSCGM